MLRNYLTIALRTLARYKGYTFINVLGLAVGMAACLLVGLYVEDELSYDTFHEQADQIMVLGLRADIMGTMRPTPATPYRLASAVADDLPEVEAATRTRGNGSSRVVRYKAKSFWSEQRILVADSTFFDVFSFPLVQGNPATVLDAPNQAVITETMARTYFGSADPIGRALSFEWDGVEREVTVAGIARDVPFNSTLQFDMVVPMGIAPLNENQREAWGALMFYTYVRLNQPMDKVAFTERVQHVIGAHVEDQAFASLALPLPELYLSDLHYTSGFSGQRRYIYLFTTVALFILLIAAINYVNLVTAQADRRAREVGVRKTMGARRGQVAQQFIGETALLSAMALVVAFILAGVALPAFNALFNKELTLQAAQHVGVLGGVAAFVLIVSVIAGAYPAFVLSGFRPVRVLHGTGGATTHSGGWLRRGLVVIQFAVSAGLILGTTVVYQQLNYVQSKNLGFDGAQVVTVELPISKEQQAVVKQEVLSHPDVQRATIGDGMPGGFNVMFRQEPEEISRAEQSDQDHVSMQPAKVDADYLSTLGIRLLAGRDFSADRFTDRTRAYILNEAAIQAMGWSVEEAVGKPFAFARADGAPEGEVIGVVENFHVESLRIEIMPVVLLMESERFSSSGGTLAAKLAPTGIRSAMDHIERVMRAVAPDEPFDYVFLDDTFDAMYRSDAQLARIFTVFAGIAILVACMGLFGLAAFAAQRRTKEVGIRKALGASLLHVVGLLSKEFTVLVVVALVIGMPVAYWGMQQWLQNFAYRIEVGPLTFLLTAAVALVVATLTVSYHALRAAHLDPVDALRTE